MTWRPDTYSNRVRTAESRREAFLGAISPEDEHRVTHASYISEKGAQRAVDALAKQGRAGYKAGTCDDCGNYRIEKA